MFRRVWSEQECKLFCLDLVLDWHVLCRQKLLYAFPYVPLGCTCAYECVGELVPWVVASLQCGLEDASFKLMLYGCMISVSCVGLVSLDAVCHELHDCTWNHG